MCCERKMCGILLESFLGYEGRGLLRLRGWSMSFCASKDHYFTESLPNKQEYIYYLNKGRSFLLSEVLGLPAILNPDYVDS